MARMKSEQKGVGDMDSCRCPACVLRRMIDVAFIEAGQPDLSHRPLTKWKPEEVA